MSPRIELHAVHPEPQVIESLTTLLLGMKGDRVGYHRAIQMLVDAAIEAATLYTVEPPQFFKFMDMMMGDLRAGVRIAGNIWDMPEHMVEVEADHINEIVRVNCRR